MRLLLTRPEPDAQRTAAALRAKGHDVIVAPLLRVEPVSDVAIAAGPWAAVLVTSANAALAIASHGRREELRGVPVFAVGRRSADAMRRAGFTEVVSADGDVADLARLVAERVKPDDRLLYLAGEDRSGDLAGDLHARDLMVHIAVVYRAVAANNLPPEAADALADGIDGVLHFSRRTVEAYINASRRADLLKSALKPVHYCLSARVAEPLAQAGAAAIQIAPRPVAAALIDLMDGKPP